MFIYNENETMKNIGRQNACILSDQSRQEIYDVIKAYNNHPRYSLIQMAIDLYVIGYLKGRGTSEC